MHPASAFRVTEAARLRDVAGERGFALIVAVAGGAPLVAHAPVILREDLRFHLSAANPLVGAIRESGRALAVITASDAYVSPDWYELDDQVPTWNYLSVEIEGAARVLGRDATVALLDDLAARYEAPLAPKPPWTRAKMNADRFEAMLAGIVAFDLSIDRLEGVNKLSQNKPEAAMLRVAARLAERGDPFSRDIADRMNEALKPRQAD